MKARAPLLVAVLLIASASSYASGCSKSGSEESPLDAGSDVGASRVDASATVDGSSGGAVGALDGAPSTTLPPLPTLGNVVATEDDDSVSITFDPFPGGVDYRVYPLPADGDISVGADGHVTVKDAIYRCAGNRESASPNIEDAGNTGSWVTTEVEGDTIGGYPRAVCDATI